MVATWLNFGEMEKRLFCKNCGKFTEHISVTLSEVIRLYTDKHPTIGKIVGAVLDSNPFSQIMDGMPFMCTQCHHIRSRG